MRTIDMTPTGASGQHLRRSPSRARPRPCASYARLRKAMAAAQALQAITGTLSDEQAGIVAKTMTAELTKQGF
ncbi:hypothetical protein H6P2_00030 (plasmid) [Variovorax sp. PBL-H6]|uniref:hypothetical protein n=1 Tax=Variovorax sp. PBL-H6 TaxID=434009 RepID=UPI001316782A|nr:hypothetical protein [Variovorax sp. PBL-H6]VTU45201.1 hypothetical protein H6P2_00030 [Variovorax sp. PBL-H6]